MRWILMTFVASAVAMILVAAAMGQTTDPAGADKQAPATPQASTKAPDSPPPAAKDVARSNPVIDRIMERGVKASAKERAEIDRQLDEIEKQVENEGTNKGDADVSGRLAAEFGVTADALTAERGQYSRGWGELVVAHTLLANAQSDVTLADLFYARSHGMGWGAIAAGLDLKLGEVVAAVKSEGRVAMGLEKGDGKAASIHAMVAASTPGGKAKGAVPKTAAAKGGATAAGAGVGTGVDLNKGVGK